MKIRLLVGSGMAALALTVLGGPATAQPPTTPAAPSGQLSPQSPGGGGSGEQIPVRDPKTGGVRWDQFGGDPAGAATDLDSFIDQILGWLQTFAAYAGVLGVVICAALTVIGIRGRSDAAKKAMTSLPYVLGGTVLAGSTATILTAIL
ncbi:hypothetical protein [Nocardia camponoti]|uniref:Uncharacterized protein n=1 Tax=Nocardia camponoti TaxID=1616106 RepID=A0A917QV27_9NOCA|nr:hypothetical protein [Nocardia camponoti]GGK68764.1 hypothetical protein GCM10011591_46080 [Nocardia camponoti]